MSKLPTRNDEFHLILCYDSRILLSENKILLSWFTDDIGWNATQEKICKRTRLTKSTVSKGIAKLIEYGYLEFDSRFSRSKNYRLTKDFLDKIEDLSKKRFNDDLDMDIFVPIKKVDDKDVKEDCSSSYSVSVDIEEDEEQKDIETTPMNEDEIALEAQKAALVFKNAFSHTV